MSAVLLGRNGKVRSDHDLVFYNHPSHDGARVGGNIVTADLDLIPGDIATIAVIVSIDLEAHPPQPSTSTPSGKQTSPNPPEPS
ncbi:TerD family protein [Streptomyces avermitilis]